MTKTVLAEVGPILQPTESSDEMLVDRLRHDDHEAFDELVARHEERLTRLVRRLLNWREDVEDVVQDVFVAVLENLERFRKESKFTTWLASIAVNRCRTFRRRQHSWLQFRKRFQADKQGPSEPPSGTIDLGERVRAAVEKLPANLRETLVLRYFEELSIAETATAMKLSRGTVEVRLNRARKRLKEMLGAQAKETLDE